MSAAATPLCCIGPFVSLLLGLGGFAGASFFAKWRPVMLPVTFALLGLAWYMAYRAPNRACNENGSCKAKRAGKQCLGRE